LARIWKYDIMPLLEEHYYGRLTRQQIHDKFGLDAIRAEAANEAAEIDDIQQLDNPAVDPESSM
jgi:5-methylcytosine-specific restriction protein B